MEVEPTDMDFALTDSEAEEEFGDEEAGLEETRRLGAGRKAVEDSLRQPIFVEHFPLSHLETIWSQGHVADFKFVSTGYACGSSVLVIGRNTILATVGSSKPATSVLGSRTLLPSWVTQGVVALEIRTSVRWMKDRSWAIVGRRRMPKGLLHSIVGID